MAINTKIQLRRDTLSNWQSKNPILAVGEVALVDKNNSANFSNPKWVIRIGNGVSNFTQLPETAYALSSDISAAIALATQSSNDELKNLELSVTTISSVVNPLPGKIDNNTLSIGLLSGALKSEMDTRSSQVSALSAEISAKVKIENKPVDYINISRVDAETYHQIIAGEIADPKTIYIVSSDNINAFGEKIINVGDATVSSDAVNLKQLNAAETKLTTTISSVSADLKELIDGATGDASGCVSAVSCVLSAQISTVSAAVSSLYLSSSTISGAIDNIYLSSTTISSTLNAISNSLSTLDDSLSDYVIGVTPLGRTGDVYKYQLTQGGENVGEPIEIPYDVFVDKGEISTIGDKKYLILTLNNEAGTVLSIETTDLVDVYTGLCSETISVGVNGYNIGAFVNNGSITTDKIGLSAVTSEKIAHDAVTNDKIADNAVNTENISALAVTEAKIANLAVTEGKIANNAVTTGKIANGAVGNAQLSTQAVSPDKMDQTQYFIFDCGDANSEPSA